MKTHTADALLGPEMGDEHFNEIMDEIPATITSHVEDEREVFETVNCTVCHAYDHNGQEPGTQVPS